MIIKKAKISIAAAACAAAVSACTTVYTMPAQEVRLDHRAEVASGQYATGPVRDAQCEWRYHRHIVATDETAYSISRAYGADLATMAQVNNLDAAFTIRSGDEVIVPVCR